jgi:chemotaxis protein MotB
MAKKKPHEEHENHERWLVSYADFITLLFAFFTVLYATSQHDSQKAKSFQESVKKAFIPFADLNWFVNFSGGDGGDSPVNPIKGFPQSHSHRSGPALDGMDEGGGQGGLAAAVQKGLEEMNLNAQHEAMGARITLAASVLFKSGSAKFQPEAFPILEGIGKVIGSLPNEILVEGHTDNQPIDTKEFPSNWELAAARSAAVVRFLNLWTKIPGNRLIAASYADQKPLVPNTNDVNRAKNRRIDILIVWQNKPTR